VCTFGYRPVNPPVVVELDAGRARVVD